MQHAGPHLRKNCVLVRDNVWGYTCRVRDLVRHMAKEDAVAGSEAPAAAGKDQSMSKLQFDQVAIKDKHALHPRGLQRITAQAGP